MDNTELDRRRQAYKDAVDKWVAAIREEEALATPDYSLHEWNLWEKAGFAEEEARDVALTAKEQYMRMRYARPTSEFQQPPSSAPCAVPASCADLSREFHASFAICAFPVSVSK